MHTNGFMHPTLFPDQLRSSPDVSSYQFVAINGCSFVLFFVIAFVVVFVYIVHMCLLFSVSPLSALHEPLYIDRCLAIHPWIVTAPSHKRTRN